ERSDVFGLGAVLCAILTGEPPFVADTREATRQLSAGKRMEGAFARLDSCGGGAGLGGVWKRGLGARKAAGPGEPGGGAAAVHAFRVESEERARRAELERVRAEGERARAEVEAREQRKRRRVQLALAAAVLLLVAAAGAFAWYTDRQAGRRNAEVLQRQIE